MKKIKAEIVSISGSKATIKFKQYDDIKLTNIKIKQFVAGPGLKAWFVPEIGSIVDYCENDDGDIYIECGAWYNDNNTEPFSGDNSKYGIEYADGSQIYFEDGEYIFNISENVQIKKKDGALSGIYLNGEELIQVLIDIFSTGLTGNLGVLVAVDPTLLAKLQQFKTNPSSKITFK